MFSATAGWLRHFNPPPLRPSKPGYRNRYVAILMPTLEELDREIWGKHDFDSHLVSTCHLLRKKPIDEFTTEDLRIMIAQSIGLQFLVPQAIGVLEDAPLIEGDCFPGDLLNVVVSADPMFYDRSPSIAARVVAVARMAVARLSASSDDADMVARIERFVNKYAT